MAHVDTLLDFDSPSLSSTHLQTTVANDRPVSVMDPFSATYEVRFCRQRSSLLWTPALRLDVGPMR